ncbi:MAG: membrane lipoprotein lipid attachment site-containing protein [Bacteroidales bacterium]|nr:membrane lipoprotein lipid attachment site-containing protein [Bacteroidales bacterium]
MKKIIFPLLGFLFILASCNSSKKNLQHGNYDEIIVKSVKKLIKKPNSNKDAELLEKVYQLANDRDLDAIKFLKLEGQPDSWDKILWHYESLKLRQNRVKPVFPLQVNGMTKNLNVTDYNAAIVESKSKAAAYFYASGKSLLETNNKQNARQAYVELMKAQEYAGSSYRDLYQLIESAKLQGISKVFVQIQNGSQFNFPPNFFEEILQGNTQQLNSDWVHYYFKDNDQVQFDYVSVVKFLNVQVSPDDTKNLDRVFKKKVEDGFEYVLDSRGNVKKDTAGNDLKKIKYKEIQCALVETIQHKQAMLNGEISFYVLFPAERLVAQRPFGSESVFLHVSARAIGDIAALDAEAKQKIQSKPIPFPTDHELIFNNAMQVQESIFRILRSNQNLFK